MIVYLRDGTYYVTKPGTGVTVNHSQHVFLAVMHVDHQAEGDAKVREFRETREQVQAIPTRAILRITPCGKETV